MLEKLTIPEEGPIWKPGSVRGLSLSRFGFLLPFVFCFLSFAASARPLMVFAAASLSDALREIGANYAAQTGEKVLFNFAASSLLARQIEAGAPADLFFSADEAKMDWVAKAGLILKGTRKSLLSNTLVVVVPSNSRLKLDSPKALADPAVKRVALADPEAVPAGVYARDYLKKIGIWEAMKPKVVPAENVRAALAAVASGNVEAGMVYRTDAAVSKRVRVACEIPASQGPRISYPMAILNDTKSPASARRFAACLESAAARRVFKRCGFVVLH